MKEAREYLIVALDVDSARTAEQLVDELADGVGGFKIGMELRSNAPTILEEIFGVQIFWDQKLHDIPNSVAGASRGFTKTGVWMFNVMAAGGKEMMKAAAEAAHEQAEQSQVDRPFVVAVTLLTSINQEVLERELRVTGLTTKEYVVHLAKLAQEAGLDGVVASAEDTAIIRKACGPGFIIVNPGIRPAGAESDDQKRIGTPRNAIQDGADYLVVGRPIIKTENPLAAARAIIEEIKAALQEKAGE